GRCLFRQRVTPCSGPCRVCLGVMLSQAVALTTSLGPLWELRANRSPTYAVQGWFLDANSYAPSIFLVLSTAAFHRPNLFDLPQRRLRPLARSLARRPNSLPPSHEDLFLRPLRQCFGGQVQRR